MKASQKFASFTLGIVTLLSLLLPSAGQGQNTFHKPAPNKTALQKNTAGNAKSRLKVALITVIRSPVSWNPDCVHVPRGGWHALVKSRKPQPLYAGELVSCGRGGVAELILASGKVTMTSGQQLPIVNVAPPERELLNAALNDLLVTAGNIRAMTPLFLSPSDRDSQMAHGAVWPETFTFEWRPFSSGTTLTLALRGASGGPTLWQEAGINGEMGRYVSLGAREALARWGETNETGILILEVHPSNGVPFKVAFSLLSAPRERSLKQDLAVWAAAPNDFLHHLGRASVFHGYALYPESAAEYEAALKRDPNNIVLRRRTAEAYKMYQNLGRAKALAQPQE